MSNSVPVKNILERGYNHLLTKKDGTAFIWGNHQRTFLESIRLIESIRDQLNTLGLRHGQRVLILAPLSPELIFLLLALLASKIAPILIDPRLDRKLWRQAIIDSQPKFIISTARLINLHWLMPWTWQMRFISINGWALMASQLDYRSTNSDIKPPITLPDTLPSENLIYTLTSGSTGNPKLISRNFSVLENQQRLSCDYLPELQTDIHLSLYGIGILQSFIHGSTTVLADDMSAAALCRLIRKHKVTRLSIPPGKLFDFLMYVRLHQFGLPSLECILTGGAPIPHWLRRWLTVDIQPYFPNAVSYLVYGSTECEPISKLNLSEFKENENDRIGYPVGKAISELSIHKSLKYKIFDQDIFEIFLHGPNCAVTDTTEYLKPGDLASFDEHGNIWLLGRSNDLICGWPATIFEEPLERLPNIKRAMGLENQGVILLFIQALPNRNAVKDLDAIHHWIQKIQHACSFNARYCIYLVSDLPVDPRHQWKLQRAQVAASLERFTRDKIY